MRLTCLLLVAALWLWALPLRAQADPESRDASASVAGDSEGSSPSPRTPYERHMDNGWKLYHDQNYPAAAAEFRAAYDADPKASPLINLALTHKKLFEYPKAIEVLELALSKHPGSMKPEHREAAEREIRELEELLAWVEVKVEPPDAKLTIDGEPHEATPGKPLALSPGMHRFRGEADGYKTVEVRRTLTSGQSNAAVELTLALVTGKIAIMAHHPDALIEVDGKQRANGSWTGLLSPGVHSVRVLRGGEAEQVNVFVREGGNHHVRQQDDGELVSDSPAPLDADKEEEPEGQRQGLYGLGSGALLTAFAAPDGFTANAQGKDRWGAAGGLNLGFRVADWAGFEVMGQFSDIRVLGDLTDPGEPDVPIKVKLVHQTWRVGGMVRIMYPPRTMFRFVATLGAGVLIERLKWDPESELDDQPRLDQLGYQSDDDRWHVGPFGEIDVGLEMEFSQVLIDVVTQNIIQSTKHLEDHPGFDDTPTLVFGPALRVGYGLWF